MKATQLLEGVLNNLAENSVDAMSHEERKRFDKTAYSIIEEFCDSEKIKYWTDYYQTAKRGTDGDNKNRN